MRYALRRFAVGLLVVVCGCARSSGSLRTPPQTDDTALSNLITLRVSIDPRLCRYDITPVVYNRTARLDGKVSGGADRRRAEKLAREAGALKVDDQLIVDPATGDSGRC